MTIKLTATFKNYFVIAALLLSSASLVAQTTYSNEGWRKNLTLSFGADALRSNAKVSHTGNNPSTYTLSSDPKFGYGLMVGAELGLADYAGIGVGLHYLQRRFQISGSNVSWVRTIPTVLIPVELRLYFLKFISFGAGGFASIPVGTTRDSFSTGNSTLVESGKTRKVADFGLTGALGVNIPLGDTLGVFGEARYNYGLTDSAANAALEEKIRDLMFTVGVKVKI